MNATVQTAPLSEEQIAHYYREGYVVARGLASEATMNAVLQVMPEQEADGRWHSVIFQHTEPAEDAALHQLLIEPRIVEAVEQIFEATARVHYGMLAVVQANGGHGLPWHQDNQYTPIVGHALNVFIALCEITPEKANLWVSPRSHHMGTQPSKANETTAPGHREALVEPDNAIALPTLHKGDVCIFNRCTYHRSLQNETSEPRYAYAAQYIAEYARYAQTGEKDPLRMPASELREIFEKKLGRG